MTYKLVLFLSISFLLINCSNEFSSNQNNIITESRACIWEFGCYNGCDNCECGECYLDLTNIDIDSEIMEYEQYFGSPYGDLIGINFEFISTTQTGFLTSQDDCNPYPNFNVTFIHNGNPIIGSGINEGCLPIAIILSCEETIRLETYWVTTQGTYQFGCPFYSVSCPENCCGECLANALISG